MSIVLIVFDAIFIHKPYVCYWPASLCESYEVGINIDDIYALIGFDGMRMKRNAIKGQLGCAVIMLLLGITFVGSYIYTAVKVRRDMPAISEKGVMEMNQPPPPV